MRWLFRCALRRVALAPLAAGPLLACAASAQAQDEVIVDPALQQALPDSASEQDELTIEDPAAPDAQDDYGWGEAANIGATPEPGFPSAQDDYDPMANTGIARLELDGRFAADLHHEGSLEDVYETRFRLEAGVEFRRSRRLRVSVGARTDWFWAVPSQNDPALNYEYLDYASTDEDGEPTLRVERYGALDQDRFELDVIPTSAYVDATLSDGFHLRIGSQQITMARADFFSPSDMLAVYDLRGQPRLDPGTPKIAQPAVRIDWDLGSWATLQAVYVPWFMPHLSRPTRDGYVAQGLGFPAFASLPALDSLIDPSFQTKASEAGARFVGPAPSFTTPQAQLRLNMRGSSYEFGITAGTALEKLPMTYMVPAVEEALRGEPTRLAELVANEIQAPLVDVEYHRFHQIGLDGSFDVAPVTVAFELTYSPSRHFYTATSSGSMLPQPNTTEVIIDPMITDDGALVAGNVTDTSIRQGVPVVQGVLHLDWIKGETFMLAAEAFWLNALALPHDRSRDWLGFKAGTGAFLAGVLGATYRLNNGQWSFETSLIALMGPSFVSASQIELRVREGFFLNIGAFIYEGQRPVPAAQALSVGGLLSGFDQVFVGFRYLP